MTEQPLPPMAQTEAPATDDDLPVTVPIRGMAKTPGTMELRLPGERRRSGDATDGHMSLVTPAVRVTGRIRKDVNSPELCTPINSLVELEHDTVEDLIPNGARPRLRVVRGRKVNLEYPIKDGPNYIGRRDDAPIEIDLEDQENSERIWTSRKHAVLHFADSILEIEDLDSLNGTFVNRIRVAPGERRALKINDIVQIGTIQLRVVV